MQSIFYAPHRVRKAAVGTLLMAGSAFAVLAPAQAQTFTTGATAPFTVPEGSFSTTTTSNSLVFDRPAITRGGVTPKPTGRSGLGSAVAYADTTFTAPTTGTYTISDALTGYGDDGTASDYVQSLYTPAFTPSKSDPASLATVIQSFNPAAQTGGSYNVSLTKGAKYVFVDHGYYNESDPSVATHGPSFGTAKTSLAYDNPGTSHFINNAAVISADGSSESLVPQTVTETLSVSSTTKITSFTGISIIGLQHGYVGDLTATLTHGGVTVVLFDHTGATNSVFQGDPGSGAIFSGSKTYTFAPTGTSLAGVAFGATVPSGTYEATPNPAGGFTTADNDSTLNDFDGQSASGVWTLSVTNNQPGNSGSYLGFSFEINGSTAKGS